MRQFNIAGRRWSSTCINPTIYALSTAQGRAALAVIRLSGPRSKTILKRLCRNNFDIESRKVYLRRLYSPTVSSLGQYAEILDEALAVYFPSPNSFTGEDVVELHVHGGRAVVNSVLAAVRAYGREVEDGTSENDVQTEDILAPVRYAEAGEFTRRAFDNGKLDLTQVEGIGNMIDAETEMQRVAAVNLAEGRSAKVYESWREDLLEIMSQMSAIIDFSEEGYFDNSESLLPSTISTVTMLLNKIRSHVRQIQRSEIVLSGAKLSLLGPPNAGKSSLLNILARRDVAIVSDIPGTTRDTIEISLDIGSYKVILIDTAGLRSLESVDRVESQGIVRTMKKTESADIIIAVLPAKEENLLWHETVRDEIRRLKKLGDNESGHEIRKKLIIVCLNKIDKLDKPESEIVQLKRAVSKDMSIPEELIFPISCLHETGIEEVLSHVVTYLSDFVDVSSELPIGASMRVQEILRDDVVPSLERFLEHAAAEDVVFASEEIRYAAESIGRITGRSIGVEEVLGVVFSKFCVGK
ncbi:GTP-binding protein TrmE N-terminus-domain-containing protein [Dipodascopsis uninucleata]